MKTRLALAIALLFGAWIRLTQVESKSLSHPEMWAPLIPLPWELADPGIRASLYEAVVHNLMADTHPPGYTIAMWFWMKAAGAPVWALRLPSVACGIASIVLVFAIARRTGSREPWIAPFLLASNGYAVMWSVVARMYAPAMFSILLATWMLLLLDEHWHDWLAALYALVLVASCSLHVYGWIFAGVHLLWSARRNRRAAWWQMLAMIVGSPLLAFAAYQSVHPVAELARNPLPFLAALAGFGIALPSPEIIDVFDSMGRPLPWNGLVSAAAAIAGVALSWTGWRSASPAATRTERPPSSIWFVPAAAASCAIVWIFVSRIAHPHQGIELARAASVIPWLFAVSWILVPRVPRAPAWPLPVFCLIAGLAIVSLATLAKPIMTLRGMQLFAPFALLLIGEGIGSLSSRTSWAIALLIPLSSFSGGQIAMRQVDPVDFRTFAALTASHLQPGDTILWRRGWDSTPVLYYLPPERFRYTTECAATGQLWEFRFYDQPLPAPLRACVADRKAEVVVEYGPAIAIRYRARTQRAASTPPPQ